MSPLCYNSHEPMPLLPETYMNALAPCLFVGHTCGNFVLGREFARDNDNRSDRCSNLEGLYVCVIETASATFQLHACLDVVR